MHGLLLPVIGSDTLAQNVTIRCGISTWFSATETIFVRQAACQLSLNHTCGNAFLMKSFITYSHWFVLIMQAFVCMQRSAVFFSPFW